MTDDSLSERLSSIARDVAKADIPQAAEEIVGAAIEMLPGCTGAGVTLVRRDHSVESAAVSDDVVRQGDALQYELGEGPCLQAVWDDEVVHSEDLVTDERWPRWAPRMVALGVSSMLCIRLFTDDDHLGALNLYAAKPHAFDAEDLDLARLLAAHAAVAVAAAREIATLRVAVDRRTTIGKALGIVMARYGLDDDRAMAVLRRLSSHQNRKLYDVALDVVHEMRVPTEDLPAPRRGDTP